MNPPRSACGSATTELARLHYRFINSLYLPGVQASWTTGGCMGEVRQRLGYRLVLQELSHSVAVRPGGVLRLQWVLRNDGYGALFNARPLNVVLEQASPRKPSPRLTRLALAGKSSRMRVLLCLESTMAWPLKKALTEQRAEVELVDDLSKGLRATRTCFEAAVLDGSVKSLTLAWAMGELKKRNPRVRLFTVGGANCVGATALTTFDPELLSRELTSVAAPVPEQHAFEEQGGRGRVEPFFVVHATHQGAARWVVGVEDPELFEVFNQLAHSLTWVPPSSALEALRGYGSDATCAWAAFEPLPAGASLEQLNWAVRRDAGRLAINTVAYLGLRIAEGLSTLHAMGVRHGAVRPMAVWVPDGGEPLLRFCALGVLIEAERRGASRGRHGFAVPRVDDVAPDDALRSMDARLCLFQLGHLLYECLTGATAFERFPFDRALVPPALLVPAVPDALSRLVVSLLERDPDQRASLEQVQRTLTANLGDVVAAREALAATRERRRVLNVSPAAST